MCGPCGATAVLSAELLGAPHTPRGAPDAPAALSLLPHTSPPNPTGASDGRRGRLVHGVAPLVRTGGSHQRGSRRRRVAGRNARAAGARSQRTRENGKRWRRGAAVGGCRVEWPGVGCGSGHHARGRQPGAAHGARVHRAALGGAHGARAPGRGAAAECARPGTHARAAPLPGPEGPARRPAGMHKRRRGAHAALPRDLHALPPLWNGASPRRSLGAQRVCADMGRPCALRSNIAASYTWTWTCWSAAVQWTPSSPSRCLREKSWPPRASATATATEGDSARAAMRCSTTTVRRVCQALAASDSR